MPVANYIIEEKTVDRVSNNKGWLETYIPEVVRRIEDNGYNVVFDQEHDFDLMHIHIPLFITNRMINNNRKNYPVVYHGHATEDSFTVGRGTKDLIRKWLRKVAGSSSVIICPSKFAEEYYRTILQRHDIRRLNYGINLEKYSYSKKARIKFRERYSIEDDEFVVCCVGGISNRKGIDDFITISKMFPDFRFMWIGGVYSIHPITRLFYKIFARQGDVRLKNVPQNLVFTGYTKEIPAVLSSSDLFFFPSRHETQGFALVEAASCGLPIVTRDLPVFEEWLTSGHDCLMGKCIEDFRKHIEFLSEDSRFAMKLGRRALISARKHHDINKTSKKVAEIYDEII